MKILITTDTFYPMINGVVISTFNLFNELKRLGHDVRILTLSNTGKERIEGDIYYLKAFKVKVYPDARVKHIIVGDLEKDLIDWKPDVIHSQTEFSTLIAARYISKKTRAIHVHTYHTMYEEYLNYIFKGKLIKPKMVGKIVKVLFNKMNAIIVPTQKMKDCLIKFNVEVPLYIVPTGLDIKKFKQRITIEQKKSLLKEYNLENKKLLIYVGRIAKEKNIDEVIKYYYEISTKIDNLKLMIVGGGPYLDILKELVDNLGIQDDVVFTGMVDPNEIYKYYQIGHIFITSSRSETQGLTYIEALASGVPVVCRSDKAVDGLIIEGENGYTYTNVDQFRVAVYRLISDEGHRKKAIEAAQIKAEEYSCEIFGKAIYSVYEEIILNEKKFRKSSQSYKVNEIIGKIF